MKKTILFMAAAMLFCACRKAQNEPQTEPQTDTQTEAQTETVNGFINAPLAFNGTFTEVCSALLYMEKNQPAGAPARVRAEETYPSYNWTPQDGSWPIDLTVAYGADGVIATDGLLHKGTLKIHATGFFETPETVLTPEFTDFYVYGNILSGKQTIENTGFNEKNNLVFKVTTEDGRLGTDKTYRYSEETFRELINGLGGNGFLTPEVTTHTYSITGRMKAESLVDTLPGCEVTISETRPMIIAVGDLYPTDGYLYMELDKPLVYNIDKITVATTDIEVEFTGKQGNNQYGATAYLTFNAGLMEQTVKVTFLLDEEGVAEGSGNFEFEVVDVNLD